MNWAKKARPQLVARWKLAGGTERRETVSSSMVRDQIVAAFRNAAPVDLANVLLTLQQDAALADQSFESWCSDTGYDEDSRKAYKIYESCRDLFFSLRNGFGARFDEFMGLEE